MLPALLPSGTIGPLSSAPVRSAVNPDFGAATSRSTVSTSRIELVGRKPSGTQTFQMSQTSEYPGSPGARSTTGSWPSW